MIRIQEANELGIHRIRNTGANSGTHGDLMLYRKQREEEQRKEAELKMLQHWRINNPAARQVTCSPLVSTVLEFFIYLWGLGTEYE
jgi:hypothetical protein